MTKTLLAMFVYIFCLHLAALSPTEKSEGKVVDCDSCELNDNKKPVESMNELTQKKLSNFQREAAKFLENSDYNGLLTHLKNRNYPSEILKKVLLEEYFDEDIQTNILPIDLIATPSDLNSFKKLLEFLENRLSEKHSIQLFQHLSSYGSTDYTFGDKEDLAYMKFLTNKLGPDAFRESLCIQNKMIGLAPMEIWADEPSQLAKEVKKWTNKPAYYTDMEKISCVAEFKKAFESH